MSGIITSFFIEPVVRQARRFSSVPESSSPNEAAAPIIDGHCMPTSSVGNEDGRARSLSFQFSDDAQAVQQSHVSTPQLTSTAAPSTTTAVTAINSNSYFNKTNPTPCSTTSTPTTVPGRQPVLSLGQTLFDRFAPLVPSRFSPFSNPVDQSTNQAAATRRRSLGPTVSGTASDIIHQVSCSDLTLQKPDDVIHSDLEAYTGMDHSNPNGSRRSDHDAVAALRESEMRHHIRTRVPRDVRTRRSRESRDLEIRALEDPYGFSMDDSERLKQHDLLVSREGDLRKKIQEICQLPLSAEEKARRVHFVMNAHYIAHQQNRKREKSVSKTGSSLLERPDSSSSINTISSTESVGDLELYKRYNVEPVDLVPTYRQRSLSDATTSSFQDGDGLVPFTSITDHIDELSVSDDLEYGCEHYKRNVKIQCFECKTWWNCRNCHDEAIPDHRLPRHLTENMLCMLCQTPGPAGQYCQNCGEQAAYYFCEICKLWDNDSTKRIYHCTDCGICRLGEGIGKDFQHCSRCNVDIPIAQFESHKCIERATDCNCPICGEYMFNSVSSIVSMICGHYLHHSCYQEYRQNSYKCPVCKKSTRNMQSEWRKIDDAIAAQPMPENLRNVSVDIRCNDCAGKSRTAFHWLGNRCDLCDSYNTVEIEVHRDVTPGVSPSPPRGNWRNARTIQARTRSYFQEDIEEQPAATDGVIGDSISGLSSTAYEVLAAMSRNLSPIRRYLNARDDNSRTDGGPATEAELERMGFWNAASDNDNEEGEWEEDDEDDEDSDDSTDTEVMFDDDSDSSSEGGFDIQLIGHR